MILQKVILEMGSVKGALKIHALPNFRSGDNRWTNFAPVNNATFQYALQLAECDGKYVCQVLLWLDEFQVERGRDSSAEFFVGFRANFNRIT